MPDHVKDYTWLPVGTKMDNGEIQACPYCKRVGLMTSIGGTTTYTHKLVIRTDSESGESFMLSKDQCPAETSAK